MIIAEWIIYLIITCFCVLALGVGSVFFVISINVLSDRKEISK